MSHIVHRDAGYGYPQALCKRRSKVLGIEELKILYVPCPVIHPVRQHHSIHLNRVLEREHSGFSGPAVYHPSIVCPVIMPAAGLIAVDRLLRQIVAVIGGAGGRPVSNYPGIGRDLKSFKTVAVACGKRTQLIARQHPYIRFRLVYVVTHMCAAAKRTGIAVTRKVCRSPAGHSGTVIKVIKQYQPVLVAGDRTSVKRPYLFCREGVVEYRDIVHEPLEVLVSAVGPRKMGSYSEGQFLRHQR